MGLEALPKVREGSGGLPGGPRRVGRPSQKYERPFRRSKRGLEAVWEVLGGLGVPPKGLGVVVRPSQRFGQGRKVPREVREAF